MNQLLNETAAAREAAYAQPLDTLDPGQPALFKANQHWWNFERLRKESPVHYTPESRYGPYWSITKFNDIMAVDTDHRAFSSEPGISIVMDMTNPSPERTVGFISMDSPKHDVQRKTVTPALAPSNLRNLEHLIRERAAKILDDLPIGVEFDWVDLVSKELTGMTLATLFGIPQEDRRKLLHWSDVVTAVPGQGLVETQEEKERILQEYFAYFMAVWDNRLNSPPGDDMFSMMAHAPDTRGMSHREVIGNVILLTIGGNDTTRNTISGSVYALHHNPEQNALLRADHGLIPSMVSETIRWQTPLAHMARRATRDIEFGGKQIRENDKVVMWYVSGNRDDEVIDRPNDYIINRERPRNHVSFGFGIHRCVGNRLAELQLKIIWEEILARFPEIIVVDEPQRSFSTMIKGYESMTTLIPRRN